MSSIVEGERDCGVSEIDAVLFDIIIPPLIKERTYLCEPCLAIAIDASKKKREP